METFSEAVVQGVPLLFVVIGLVQIVKSFGVDGNVLRAVSMGVGVLLGAGFLISTNGLPAEFAGWFGTLVYGLGLGIVASGVYDAGKSIARG